jgi:hypothetical protein
VLLFASVLGPDNAHPNEYAGARSALDAAIRRIASERWSARESDEFATTFLEGSDRFLFNGTAELIEQFFDNPDREVFATIAARLGAGGCLTIEDVRQLDGYIRSLDKHVEYQLGNLLFILSSLNDLEATLAVAEAEFASFTDRTAPEAVDFFEAVLVYIHVLHGLDYDSDRFARWDEAQLTRWPNILMYRPGETRGERRGFLDQFDRNFEDGFGVAYAYGTLLPGLHRRSVMYRDYVEASASDLASALPLYRRVLDDMLADGMIEEAVQVLQILSGVVIDWPREGLGVLTSAIGSADPRIRRGTVRVIAEAFHRHPTQTMQYLREGGAAVTSEDLVEIKVRRDASIGRRQICEQQWARMAHVLVFAPGAKMIIANCVVALANARSARDGIRAVLEELTLLDPR